MRAFFSKIRYKKMILPLVFIILMFAFMLVLLIGNNYRANLNRKTDGFHEVSEIKKLEVEDDSLPQGTMRIYEFTLDEFHTNANCIAFQVVHYYAVVYIGDELVYSFYPAKETKVGKTLGCDWIFVPIVASDTDKVVKIELTPVYEDIIDKEIIIYHGNHYDIFIDILVSDLLWLIISIGCISIGLIFIISHINAKIHHNAHKKSQFYLGLIAVLLSFWRMFDMDLAPVFVTGNPRILFYISYLSLLVVPLPFIKYVECLFGNKKSIPLRSLFLTYFAYVLLMIFLQIINVFDMRSNIIVMLLIIVVVIVLVLIIVLIEGEFINKRKDNLKQLLPLFIGILSIGGIIDIIIYVSTTSTDNLVFTFISFFIYALIVVLYSSSENTKLQYRDFQTGLYNSNSCKEFISDNLSLKNCCAMMFDLNGLKVTNDNYGHAEGDLLIIDLTTILKKSIPMNDFIGRCGGDEFIAIIHECNYEKINKIVDNLDKELEAINCVRDIKLSFSYGWALSNEHNCNLSDLLKIADKKMYEHKNHYYKNKQ